MKTAYSETPTPARINSMVLQWMQDHATACLRISLGLIFILFGGLKFFPGLSPAEQLAGNTLHTMSLGLLAPSVSLPLLATFETLIGLTLLLGSTAQAGWRKTLFYAGLPLFFLHMLGTVMPLLLQPGQLISFAAGTPLISLECQYILKNAVLISAAMVLGSGMGHARKIHPSA